MDERKLELLPQPILDRIDYMHEEKQGEAAAYARQFMERHGLDTDRALKKLYTDQKYQMLKRRDKQNKVTLELYDLRWEQLRDLGAWVLDKVSASPETYERWPSLRDVCHGKPSRVTKEEMALVLDHLVELGLLEPFESKPARGPSATRYRMTDDGREVLTMLEVEG